MMMAGEIFAQKISSVSSREDLEHLTLEKLWNAELKWNRVARACFIGSFLGFYQHFYYQWLDRFIVGTSNGDIVRKVIMDELLIATSSLSIFFTLNGWLDHGSFWAGIEHTKNLFVTAYVADIACWPAFQAFNFKFIPLRFRIVYISVLTVFWNSFLCVLNIYKR